MIDLTDDKLNAMAIAIGKSRGVKPRWIKLESKRYYDENENKWCNYQNVKPSWDEYADEAKTVLKEYEKQIAKGPIFRTPTAQIDCSE